MMRPKKQPADIDVHLFREILLIPFAIEAKKPLDPTYRRGRSLMSDITTLLDNDDAWTRIEDRTMHVTDYPSMDEASPTLRERVPAYEEYTYFEPYVQKFLFGQRIEERNQAPISIHRRHGIKGLQVDYLVSETGPDRESKDNEPKTKTFNFEVRRCNFYTFETGNAILVFELEYDAGSGNVKNGKPRINLAEVLYILEGLRRIFPPYYAPMDVKDEQGQPQNHASPDAILDTKFFPKNFKWIATDDDHLSQSKADRSWQTMVRQVFGNDGSAGPSKGPRGLPMFQPWFDLLSPLPIEGYKERSESAQVHLSQMGDDRAFTIAQIGVEDTHVIRQMDWIRLCFLDTPGLGYPYSPEFLERNFDHRHCYDRFFSPREKGWLSTRTLITDYSFVCVGTTTPPFLPDQQSDQPNDKANPGERSDFFRHTISKHVRRHYFQLCLISYLQKIALLTLSERVASVVNAENENKDGFDDLQQDVHGFTHRYWFEQISSQAQAKELFEMLRSNMKTRDVYNQLSQEVREAAERAEMKKQTDLAEAGEQLSRVAGIGLAATVFVGIFGMNIFGSASSEDHLNFDVSGAILVLTAIIVGGAFVWLYKHQPTSKKQSPNTETSRLLPETKITAALSVLILLCGFLL